MDFPYFFIAAKSSEFQRLQLEEEFDILFGKRFSGVAEQGYAALYGKSWFNQRWRLKREQAKTKNEQCFFRWNDYQTCVMPTAKLADMAGL
jgi:hypothetical protein